MKSLVKTHIDGPSTAGWAHRPTRKRVPVIRLLAGAGIHGMEDLLLDGFEVEARALLHRRELDGGLGQLRHLLLDVDEAPELVT